MSMKNGLTSIPLSRLLVYLMILFLLPTFSVGYRFVKKNREWDAVQMRILSLHTLSASKERKQYLNNLVRQNFSGIDQFFIENQLESLQLLKREREALEKLFQSPTFTGNEAAEKRFAAITSKSNRLEWTQGNLQSADGIQEGHFMLSHPVEIDTQDLKEILTRIEGTRKGKPQLIVTDFKLLKKAKQNGNEVYELNMKLLKREFS